MQQTFYDQIESVFAECFEMYVKTVEKNLGELQANIHRICSQ